ncbi:MAG: KamA family radical SAM protein [Chloroflexi bacterium]|nr:KamA family radical SAM protein [Chloroflexota bacterium]
MKTTEAEIIVQEDEPPGTRVKNEAEEEPPSKTTLTTKTGFFSHVSQENWNDWCWQFRNRITTVEQLAKAIPLLPKEQVWLRLVISKYPFSVTPYYFSLINWDNPDDPVKKQALPSFQEIAMAGMGTEDPLEEKRDSVVPGLVHRYPDRVLMVLTDICPMLCRHCTRKREWHHGGWVRSQAEIDAMLNYIDGNKAVRDVIVSGGDPLVLSTHHLEQVLSGLRRIPHVEIIRIGTRCPVVLPQRIDDELCAMLSKYGPIWLNTHFNHPNEITEASARACDKLLRSGVPVNNQTVLLRGVNDSVETQTKLCHSLLKIKVRPYYLFQCDEVQGTEHFRTPLGVGIKIMEQMRGHTSGLAVPTFVVDLPGGGGKVPIMPNYVLSQSEDEFTLRNYEGRIIHFRNPTTPPTNSGKRRNDSRNGGSNQLAFCQL